MIVLRFTVTPVQSVGLPLLLFKGDSNRAANVYAAVGGRF